MKVKKEHKSLCGVYLIQNIINNKVYIGVSINIAERIWNHVSALTKGDRKRENQLFIDEWLKFGRDNFKYEVLEVLDKNHSDFSKYSKLKECYWIEYYNSTNSEMGYNLRKDNVDGMVVHADTIKRYSESKLAFYRNNTEARKVISENSKKFWENNPEVKEEMKKKLQKIQTKYYIDQYSKDGSTFIRRWDYVSDIIRENPTYKKHNIYSVCYNHKPSMYGFKWFKILKDDIVQSSLKDEVDG